MILTRIARVEYKHPCPFACLHQTIRAQNCNSLSNDGSAYLETFPQISFAWQSIAGNKLCRSNFLPKKLAYSADQGL